MSIQLLPDTSDWITESEKVFCITEWELKNERTLRVTVSQHMRPVLYRSRLDRSVEILYKPNYSVLVEWHRQSSNQSCSWGRWCNVNTQTGHSYSCIECRTAGESLCLHYYTTEQDHHSFIHAFAASPYRNAFLWSTRSTLLTNLLLSC